MQCLISVLDQNGVQTKKKKDCYRSLGCAAWLVHAESRMLQDSQEQFGKKRKGSVVFPYQTKG